MKNASITYEGKRRQEPKVDESDITSAESIPSADYSISLRDKAMIHARVSEPSATLLKLDKIESSKPKKKSPTVIPSFESRELNARDSTFNSSYEGAMKQLREMKSLHDSLAVEADAKEKQFHELENTQRTKLVGDLKSQKHRNDGVKSLVALQSRLEHLNGLVDTASNAELSFQKILLALASYDPANQRDVQLEQQVRLSTQQMVDLKQERGVITKETEKIEARSKKVSDDAKAIAQERHRIEPLLETLRNRANDDLIRSKAARVTSFDPAAFSRRVRIEGKIAKRRENKLKHKQSCAGGLGVVNFLEPGEMQKAAKLHPMEKLAQAAGTRDPAAIMQIFNESETQVLRTRLRKGEMKVKEQLAKLETLGSQTKVIHLADGDVEIRSAASIDKSNVNMEAVLSRKQEKMDSLSQLVQNISLAILNLSGMVQSIEGDQSLNEFAHFAMEPDDHTKLDEDVQQLVQSITSLRKEIPSEFSLLAKKNESNQDQTRHHNIRILARSEQESRFAAANGTEQLRELEDEDSNDNEQDTDEDFGKLASYINHGIHTNASQNQQRQANLLSHAKQGKYANKGMILEAVLFNSTRIE